MKKENVTKCKYCGNIIPINARICIKCGKSNRERYKKLIIPILILLIFFIIIPESSDNSKSSSNNDNLSNELNNDEKESTISSSDEITTEESTEQQVDVNNSEKNSLVNNQDNNEDIVFNIKYGELGNYGKKDEYNYRYYLPSGNYEIINNTESFSGFFIVKNDKVKNSEGRLEDVIIEDIRFKSNEKSKNIVIPEDAHILLFLNSDINFKKIKN